MGQLNDETIVSEPTDLRGLLEQCVRGDLGVLSGPTGIGKTTILRRAAEILALRGTPATLVSCRTDENQLTLLTCPSDRMLLVDDSEFAHAGTLRFLLERLRAGAPTILALNEAHWSAPFGEALDDALIGHEELIDVLAQVPRVRLEPWSPGDIERLAHHKKPLASSDIAAIVELAQGRPLWAEQLVTLMAEQKVDSYPFPRLVHLSATDLRARPFLRAREAVDALEPGALEIALALAKVSEISALFARTLLGDRRFEQLLERGLLLTTGPRQSRVRANRFVLPTLAAEADHRLVDSATQSIVEHFLAARVAGDQLSAEEIVLSAKVLLQAAPTNHPGEAPGHVIPRAQLFLHAMDVLADAGEHEEARECLLAAQLLGASVDPIRLARASGDPASALHHLQAINIDTTDETERLALQIVCTNLRSEQGVPTPMIGAVAHPTDPLILAWSSSEALSPATKKAIVELAFSSEEPPEVSLLALSLLIFESVWHGRAIARSLAAEAALRYQLTYSSLGTCGQVARDARATFAIVLGLAELLHGPEPTLNEVFSLHGPRASLASPWAPWAYPLRGAIRALRGEYPSLALDEWDRFTENLPRFLPARLRRSIRTLRQTILGPGSPAHPAEGPRKTPSEGRAYPAVLLHAFSSRSSSPEGWLPALPAGAARKPSPVLSALQQAQLALRIASPGALCDAAVELRSCGLPRHALEAVNAATQILLRRRASQNNYEAAQLLTELQAEARQSFPFIPVDQLYPQERKSLSPRERETAALAGQGFSNKEIAAKMRLSVRTVESHIAQARAKLGADTRHQIAERLSAHPSVTQAGLSSPTPQSAPWSRGSLSRSSTR